MVTDSQRSFNCHERDMTSISERKSAHWLEIKLTVKTTAYKPGQFFVPKQMRYTRCSQLRPPHCCWANTGCTCSLPRISWTIYRHSFPDILLDNLRPLFQWFVGKCNHEVFRLQPPSPCTKPRSGRCWELQALWLNIRYEKLYDSEHYLSTHDFSTTSCAIGHIYILDWLFLSSHVEN